MNVCPACTKANEDRAAFCIQCGASLPATAYIPSQPSTQQPAMQQLVVQETSGLAIASMICGLLFFIFPAAVLAVAFGHISSSQIRKSVGRLKGAGMSLAGMILGYAGIALAAIILIIAALVIPNLAHEKIIVNESIAAGSLRAIATAAIEYQDSYHGDPSGLSALGPPLAGHGPDADGAGLVARRLMSGSRDGYMFQYHPVSSHNDGVIDGFDINADPITPGATGTRHFHIDESGEIRFEMSAPAGRNSPRLG